MMKEYEGFAKDFFANMELHPTNKDIRFYMASNPTTFRFIKNVFRLYMGHLEDEDIFKDISSDIMLSFLYKHGLIDNEKLISLAYKYDKKLG